jgi:tRNA nucleotidyltransferase/poly(A) polymerase
LLRGIRQAAALGFKIVPETRQLMKSAVPGLASTSPERLRDEVFKILGGPHPHTCLHALEMLGALHVIFPEISALKDEPQSPPHVYDIWTHTLDMLGRLETLLEVLAPAYDADKAASLALGLVSHRLGRYRQQLAEHLQTPLNTDRPLRPLLFLAALYHDIAKPATRSLDEQGQYHFYRHDEAGSVKAAERARRLRLSNPEIERLQAIVRHHMRPFQLAQSGELPTRRAVYRFFRDAGPAGVDICLLSLADFLATYGATLPQETWAHHLEVVRMLLDAWWEKADQVVAPPSLVSGHDLIKLLHLEPGPRIGQLLEAIREAQAIGQIHTREEAVALARQQLAAPGQEP